MKKSLILLLGMLIIFLSVLTACQGNSGQKMPEDEVTTDLLTGETPEALTTEEPTTEELTESHVHAFSDWIIIQEATCTEAGEQERVCDCGEKETQSMNVLAHTEVQDIAVDPTCTNNGATEGTHCSICKQILIAQEIVPATGHSYGEWYVTAESTCTEDGMERHDCANCDHYEEQSVDALGHSYETVITDPSCTEKGYTTYTCTCGEAYVDSYVDATGHQYESVITEPTTYDQGYTTHICQLCQDTYIDSFVPELGSAGLAYEANTDGTTCTLTGIGTCTEQYIVIPSTIDGYTVTAIGDAAFTGQINIAFVQISDTVKTIGAHAFDGCTGLMVIVMGNGVTSVGDYAFFACSGLTDVYFLGTEENGMQISIGSNNTPLFNANVHFENN